MGNEGIYRFAERAVVGRFGLKRVGDKQTVEREMVMKMGREANLAGFSRARLGGRRPERVVMDDG